MSFTARGLLIGISAASALAMLYVGAYQIRAVDHLKCPILGGGCEAVADAPFARPLGVPDGFIGAGMYGLLIVLALAGSQTTWIQYSIRGVAIFATLANLDRRDGHVAIGSLLFLLPADDRAFAVPGLVVVPGLASLDPPGDEAVPQ